MFTMLEYTHVVEVSSEASRRDKQEHEFKIFWSNSQEILYHEVNLFAKP